jgi:serine/threonine-protein kinase
MAPEQVRGQAADQRTDLFALGIVLHELLTARAPFRRETPMETMTAILKEEPPELTTVNAKIPIGLSRLVQHCLEKNPSERFQSARDLAYSLKALTSETPSSEMSVPGVAAARAFAKLTGRWSLAWLGGAVALLALGVIAGMRWLGSPPGPERTTILDVALPAGVEVGAYPSAAFSSDGREFVFGGSDKRGTALWLRSLALATSVKLLGTEGAELPQQPIWSPDSHYLLFAADRKVKKLELASGTAETLWTGPSELAASGESYFFAGDWNGQGEILFSWGDLYRLRGSGGKPEPVAVRQPDDLDIIAGQWLPDGRHYLFHVKNRASGRGSVFVGTLGSTERVSILTSDSPATYVDPGYLLFVQSGGLFAQRFDAVRLSLAGQPVHLVDGAEAAF